MKRLAKALALLEGLCLALTLSLAVWTARSAMAGIGSVRVLQGISPGPQTDDLARWQANSTWLAAGAEALWATMAVLGAVAVFGLWRFRPVGLYASVLLSSVYVAEILGSNWPGRTWMPMGALVSTRLVVAAVLARWGMIPRHG